MKIRSISIEYSIKKSKQEKETTRIFENDIQNLENEMNLRPRDCTQILLNQKSDIVFLIHVLTKLIYSESLSNRELNFQYPLPRLARDAEKQKTIAE
jgi:hypothetical protein